ncbi:MAG: cellulase family glycosylhydrolase [Planctomycetota bacterium]|nr:MAG: cellulase family glycosylhydrolase [Planctomycetota bacterium]
MLRIATTLMVFLATVTVSAATELQIKGTQFTVNDKPVFLYGISYYGALGAPESFIERDLVDMKKLGINWIRVWAVWQMFDNNVSALDENGNLRESYFEKLKWLIEKCDQQGIIVDVTLTRGTATYRKKQTYIQTLDAHKQAVETLVSALKPYRNWYIDLGNERNYKKDKRYVSIEDLKQLRKFVKKLDPKRLVTASQAGDIDDKELGEYVLTAQVDFITPHRPRHAGSPQQTEVKTQRYLKKMKELGRIVPVHYQEPFRRGWKNKKGWQPTGDEFAADFHAANKGGAAGWCLHNGDDKFTRDRKPRRSFDMREKRLFEQLDAEEHKALKKLSLLVSSNDETKLGSLPEIVSVKKIWDQAPHNAFTDLIRFQGKWFCTFREGAAHAGGSTGTIRVLTSVNGEKWESAALLSEKGIDLRDPKLSITTDGKLMLSIGGSLYKGKQRITNQSRVSFSRDGRTWSKIHKVLSEKQWLWRVTWYENRCYGVSYNCDPGQHWTLKLWISRDGLNYELITRLDVPGRPNETTLRFLPGGKMMALVRRESGNRLGWIGLSRKPYKKWKWHETEYRIGGPNFIRLRDGSLWAAGRKYNNKATTVLAKLKLHTYQPVLTLPSGGDCSYPGLVWHDGLLWMSYYSSHQGKTSIYLAKIRFAR